jgi:hypothetical protein
VLGDLSNTSAAAAKSRDACRADDCDEEKVGIPRKNRINMYDYEGDVFVVCGDVFSHVQHIMQGCILARTEE